MPHSVPPRPSSVRFARHVGFRRGCLRYSSDPSRHVRSCRCIGIPNPCLVTQRGECDGQMLLDGLHGNAATPRHLTLAQPVDPDQHEHLPAARRQRQHGLAKPGLRSEEHTSELQSLMRISYAVSCLKKKKAIHTKLQYYDEPNFTRTSMKL